MKLARPTLFPFALPTNGEHSRLRAWLLPLLLLGLSPTLRWAHTAQDEEAAPGTQPGTVLALSLADALRMALENNLDLEIAEITTETARYDAIGSWGAFDPTINLNLGYTERDELGTSSLSGAPSSTVEEDTESFGGGITWPFQSGGQFNLDYSRRIQETNNTFVPFRVSTLDIVTTSLTQPLLRGAWKRYGTSMQRQSELTHEREAENERLIRQRMTLDVENAYWDLVSAHEEVGVRKLAESLGQKQLEQDQARYDVGTGTEVDVLQAETNLAQQRESLLEAEDSLRAAEDSLRRLLFQKPQESSGTFFEEWDWPIETLTPLPDTEAGVPAEAQVDWRVSMQRAIRSRPELWQSRIDVEFAEISLERARSERKPRLDLTLSASAGGFGKSADQTFQQAWGFDFPTYTAGLEFSAPLRNRTAIQAERAARANVRKQRLVYDRMELDVLSEIRTAVRDVRYRREAVIAARLSLDLAGRQLEAEEARYANDLSTTFQVLEFQRDLASALSAERSATAALAKARAALEHAEGRIGTSSAPHSR